MIETLKQQAEEELREWLGDLQPEEAAIMVLLHRRLANETTKS